MSPHPSPIQYGEGDGGMSAREFLEWVRFNRVLGGKEWGSGVLTPEFLEQIEIAAALKDMAERHHNG
jgi:hypothetical protein